MILPPSIRSADIHPSAFISDKNLIIGKNLKIHQKVTILSDVSIEDYCIHSRSVLGTAFLNKRIFKGIGQLFYD